MDNQESRSGTADIESSMAAYISINQTANPHHPTLLQSSPIAPSEDRPILLHPNDVLFGRGPDVARHTGNQYFRSFVEEQKLPYSLAKNREDKMKIINAIIQRIRSLDPPGRFLESIDEEREKKGCGGVTVSLLRNLQYDVNALEGEQQPRWKLADEEKAITKVRIALRKHAPTRTKKNDTKQLKGAADTVMAEEKYGKNITGEPNSVNCASIPATLSQENVHNGTSAPTYNIDATTSVSTDPHSQMGVSQELMPTAEISQAMAVSDLQQLDYHGTNNHHFTPYPVPSLSLTREAQLSLIEESHPGVHDNVPSTPSSRSNDDDSSEGADDAECAESIAMDSFLPGDLTIGSHDLMSIATGLTHQQERESIAETLTIGSLAMMSITSDRSSEHEENYSTIYESLSTCIVYLHDKEKIYGGQKRIFALKTLVDQYPSVELISRLENEYKVSQYLSKCTSARSALKLVTNDGFHALYLEWAEGVTLKEWIKSVHTIGNKTHNEEPQKNIDFETAVRLSLEISKALDEMHQFGVAHNNLTPENIIVNVHEASDRFSVKIIDLGVASILEGNDSSKLNDMASLGIVFYELFCGKDPFHKRASMDLSTNCAIINDNKREPNNDQPLRKDFFLSMMNASVPLSVAKFVLNLTKSTGSGSFYHSMPAVITDLYSMLDNPKKYLISKEDDARKGRLNFPKGKLYGRGRHLMILMDAYRRVSQADGSSEMVLISGYSGAGKSALVHQLRQTLNINETNFLIGKFDQFHQIQPLSAVLAAFSEFCKNLIEKDNEDLHRIRRNIKEAVGAESSILEVLIPNLRKITGAPSTDITSAGGTEAQNRFKYVFRLFVRAITPPNQPLVLCLDDLQWADLSSLELITSLITDANNTSLLLIGLYRENEVTAEHPMSVQLEYIKSKVKINQVNVGHLDKTDVNELISDTLEMPQQSTQPLTDTVYRKTSGNVFFVLQFIKTLYDEGVISFSFDTGKWHWEMDLINSKNISDDAVGLMSRKILHFPEEAQCALKMMACLGPLSEEIVKCLIIEKNVDEGDVKSYQCFSICRSYHTLLRWLDFSVDEGLLDHTSSGYNFAHDQIQLAVYSLIPENERGLWHLQIGVQLWANRNMASKEMVFTTVGQLNKGISFVDDKYQRIEIASLNLQAGEKAIALAVYPLAASFLETGVNLLGEKCWEEVYDLSLKLYVSCAEVHYYNGNFEKMNQSLDVIFTFARSFDDKHQAYLTQVRALGAQTKVQEAIKIGLFVLENLGETFPTLLDESVLAVEILKTKQILEERLDVDPGDFHMSKDKRMIAKMQWLGTLTMLASLATSTHSKYQTFLPCRMVQLSVKDGLCNESALSFASFGYILCNAFNDIKGAYYLGQISLRLVEKFKLDNQKVRVYTTVYSGINSWLERHQASIKPLKYGYKLGMSCGDIQYAFVCATQFCIHSFQCGENLEIVDRTMKIYCDEMLEHKQELPRKRLQVWRQTVLNLMGRSDDPLKLVGEALVEDPFLDDSLECRRGTPSFPVYFNCSWLAYLFGKYELASKLVEILRMSGSNAPIFTHANDVFIHGLISLVLARNSNEATYRSIADDSIEKMTGWSEHASSNFQHKLLLLQAEYAFLLGASEDAAAKYDMAIIKAGENGFIQEQAMACELAGLFYWAQGNASQASHFYGQAHDKYLQWGAKGKADHLRLNCPF